MIARENAEPSVAQDSILAGIKGQDRILGYRLFCIFPSFFVK